MYRLARKGICDYEVCSGKNIIIILLLFVVATEQVSCKLIESESRIRGKYNPDIVQTAPGNSIYTHVNTSSKILSQIHTAYRRAVKNDDKPGINFDSLCKEYPDDCEAYKGFLNLSNTNNNKEKTTPTTLNPFLPIVMSTELSMLVTSTESAYNVTMDMLMDDNVTLPPVGNFVLRDWGDQPILTSPTVLFTFCVKTINEKSMHHGDVECFEGEQVTTIRYDNSNLMLKIKVENGNYIENPDGAFFLVDNANNAGRCHNTLVITESVHDGYSIKLEQKDLTFYTLIESNEDLQIMVHWSGDKVDFKVFLEFCSNDFTHVHFAFNTNDFHATMTTENEALAIINNIASASSSALYYSSTDKAWRIDAINHNFQGVHFLSGYGVNKCNGMWYTIRSGDDLRFTAENGQVVRDAYYLHFVNNGIDTLMFKGLIDARIEQELLCDPFKLQIDVADAHGYSLMLSEYIHVAGSVNRIERHGIHWVEQTTPVSRGFNCAGSTGGVRVHSDCGKIRTCDTGNTQMAMHQIVTPSLKTGNHTRIGDNRYVQSPTDPPEIIGPSHGRYIFYPWLSNYDNRVVIYDENNMVIWKKVGKIVVFERQNTVTVPIEFTVPPMPELYDVDPIMKLALTELLMHWMDDYKQLVKTIPGLQTSMRGLFGDIGCAIDSIFGGCSDDSGGANEAAINDLADSVDAVADSVELVQGQVKAIFADTVKIHETVGTMSTLIAKNTRLYEQLRNTTRAELNQAVSGLSIEIKKNMLSIFANAEVSDYISHLILLMVKIEEFATHMTQSGNGPSSISYLTKIMRSKTTIHGKEISPETCFMSDMFAVYKEKSCESKLKFIIRLKCVEINRSYDYFQPQPITMSHNCIDYHTTTDYIMSKFLLLSDHKIMGCHDYTDPRGTEYKIGNSLLIQNLKITSCAMSKANLINKLDLDSCKHTEASKICKPHNIRLITVHILRDGPMMPWQNHTEVFAKHIDADVISPYIQITDDMALIAVPSNVQQTATIDNKFNGGMIIQPACRGDTEISPVCAIYTGTAYATVKLAQPSTCTNHSTLQLEITFMSTNHFAGAIGDRIQGMTNSTDAMTTVQEAHDKILNQKFDEMVDLSNNLTEKIEQGEVEFEEMRYQLNQSWTTVTNKLASSRELTQSARDNAVSDVYILKEWQFYLIMVLMVYSTVGSTGGLIMMCLLKRKVRGDDAGNIIPNHIFNGTISPAYLEWLNYTNGSYDHILQDPKDLLKEAESEALKGFMGVFGHLIFGITCILVGMCVTVMIALCFKICSKGRSRIIIPMFVWWLIMTFLGGLFGLCLFRSMYGDYEVSSRWAELPVVMAFCYLCASGSTMVLFLYAGYVLKYADAAVTGGINIPSIATTAAPVINTIASAIEAVTCKDVYRTPQFLVTVSFMTIFLVVGIVLAFFLLLSQRGVPPSWESTRWHRVKAVFIRKKPVAICFKAKRLTHVGTAPVTRFVRLLVHIGYSHNPQDIASVCIGKSVTTVNRTIGSGGEFKSIKTPHFPKLTYEYGNPEQSVYWVEGDGEHSTLVKVTMSTKSTDKKFRHDWKKNKRMEETQRHLHEHDENPHEFDNEIVEIEDESSTDPTPRPIVVTKSKFGKPTTGELFNQHGWPKALPPAVFNRLAEEMANKGVTAPTMTSWHRATSDEAARDRVTRMLKSAGFAIPAIKE